MRHATLYDALAGRVDARGLHEQSKGDKKPVNNALAPDEVLARKKNAPYIDLSSNPDLPDSDLLNSIHLHAADKLKDASDFVQCMDETALLAMGVLIEEAVQDMLGESGAYVFAETSRDRPHDID